MKCNGVSWYSMVCPGVVWHGIQHNYEGGIGHMRATPRENKRVHGGTSLALLANPSAASLSVPHAASLTTDVLLLRLRISI